MKALMYHYVRPWPEDLPYFRYLHIDDFCRQLDWLQKTFSFPSWEEVREARKTGVSPEGVILTFDDGFRDHYDYVLPELQARNLWGFFFVPTAPLEQGVILDVHRLHLILGRLGGEKALEALQGIVDDSMIVDEDLKVFQRQTYTQQTNDDAKSLFKKTMNYYISYEHRHDVITQLFCAVYGANPPSADSVYLSADQIAKMADAGMVIGSHGTNHLVFSRLQRDEQEFEIANSISTLQRLTGHPIETFCYPYGGAGTFTAETEGILEKNNISLSFAVRPADISGRDFSDRPQSLPRYNCNQFPHGQAWLGVTPPPSA